MTTMSTPEGTGAVSGAPKLPEGFADTFTSRFVDTGVLRLHAVIGGEGIGHNLPQEAPGAFADAILELGGRGK